MIDVNNVLIIYENDFSTNSNGDLLDKIMFSNIVLYIDKNNNTFIVKNRYGKDDSEMLLNSGERNIHLKDLIK